MKRALLLVVAIIFSALTFSQIREVLKIKELLLRDADYQKYRLALKQDLIDLKNDRWSLEKPETKRKLEIARRDHTVMEFNKELKDRNGISRLEVQENRLKIAINLREKYTEKMGFPKKVFDSAFREITIGR